jgi:RHS repeat-associated protein
VAEEQFVWSVAYIDGLILRDRNGDLNNATGVNGLEERVYALQDALWNTTALVDVNGNVLNRFAYTPYGVVETLNPNWTHAASPSIPWAVLFRGYFADEGTGLLHARARQYSPTLGRFVSRDPIGYVDGSSLYAAYFVPNYTDPSGENLQLAYYSIMIGIAAFGAVGNWVSPSTSSAAGSLYGITDPGKISETSFKAGPGGVSLKKDKCPQGNKIGLIAHVRWSRPFDWLGYRELKVFVNWSWSGGTISGRLSFSQDTNGDARDGIHVVGININITEKKFECECISIIPCVEGTVEIREVVNQPWPSNNIDRTTPYDFRVCADGTGP